MTPGDELDRLTASVRNCRLCGDGPKPLRHEPRPILVVSTRARILIASQAPGTRPHASGVPFNDPSGDRLRDWFAVSRDEFYEPDNFAILPMGFCFPGQDVQGGDLPPRRECAPAWRGAMLDAMPRIDLVLAIGLYAQRWHIGPGRSASLTETVRDWRKFVTGAGRPLLLPLPHPSWRNSGWLKKNLWFETDFLPFLRAEIRRRLDATKRKERAPNTAEIGTAFLP